MTEEFATLGEIKEAARLNLSSKVWNFLEGGGGEEATVRANRAAFSRWLFRPRVLPGIGQPSTATEFLGISLAMPVMTAPFGPDIYFHPQGQKAVARANQRFGTASLVPAVSAFSLEEVASEAPVAAAVFQLHSVGRDDTFLELASRAEAAGYQALCVTVDRPVGGWRDRVLHDRFAPSWNAVTANYPDEPGGTLSELHEPNQPLWSWDRLGNLCSKIRLPFVVKGILTGEDARAAIEIGAKGIVVSNHGGRQLDWAPATLDQLPEIVAEVGSKAAIALDGGIRRGTDILKAIALGASVVFVGRLAALGLAADGESGVFRTLELLQAELTTTMALVGRGTISSIDRSLLQPARLHE